MFHHKYPIMAYIVNRSVYKYISKVVYIKHISYTTGREYRRE